MHSLTVYIAVNCHFYLFSPLDRECSIPSASENVGLIEVDWKDLKLRKGWYVPFLLLHITEGLTFLLSYLKSLLQLFQYPLLFDSSVTPFYPDIPKFMGSDTYCRVAEVDSASPWEEFSPYIPAYQAARTIRQLLNVGLAYRVVCPNAPGPSEKNIFFTWLEWLFRPV